MPIKKTGECFYREESGALWRADSYMDEETQEVTTTHVHIEDPAPVEDPAP